jgi:hypothetical protein
MGLVRNRLDLSAPPPAGQAGELFQVLSAQDLHVRRDGSFDVAFQYVTRSQLNEMGNGGSGVAHFSRHGRLDLNYGTNGAYRTPAAEVRADLFAFDNRDNVSMITTSGAFSHEKHNAYFRRITAQGKPDTTLRPNGLRKLIDFNDIITRVVRTDDGHLIALGIGFVRRYNRNFTLDTTFANAGELKLTNFPDYFDAINESNGTLIAVGQTLQDNDPVPGVSSRTAGLRVFAV